MIRVGIAGGIGSGKSWICQVFGKLGIPVYNADLAAGKLTENDPAIRRDLIALLGENIYQGKYLNRPEMAALIFSNRELLKKANKIIHPRVVDDFQTWCSTKNGFPYLIHESALLFENELYRMFDFIILVTAPEDIRFRRVSARDGMTSDKFHAILKNQSHDTDNIAHSQLVLINDGKHLVLPPILKFHTDMILKKQITATA
jgi:dephospho-CoA kinase